MAEPEPAPVAEIVEGEGDDFRNLPDTTDPRVARIVQYRLDGKTWEEIAGLLGLTPRTIWALRHKHSIDEFVQQAVLDAMDSARRSFISLTRKTEEKLHELLDSTEKGDRQWAIDRILNMQARVSGDAAPRTKVDPPVNPPPRRHPKPALPAQGQPTTVAEQSAPGQPSVDDGQADTRADVIRRAREAAKRRAERG